jgi:hypothetical protein
MQGTTIGLYVVTLSCILISRHDGRKHEVKEILFVQEQRKVIVVKVLLSTGSRK